MPYAPYNGVGPVPGGSWGGYCPHQSPQLIPWHRAFLVLYEQTLGDEVQRLALEYNNDDGAAYREASQKLRLPYWDWASDPTLPPSSTQKNITVNGPDGKVTLHNPLYSYRWQTYPLNETQFPGQGKMGPETTRHGGETDMTKFIKDSVYRTFSSATTYDEMASMAGSGSSFESPHNAIHNSVGGSFLSLDLTAFDTLFMLHHCNLDRLSAMWTASHRETLQGQPFTSQGLYSTAKGEVITADSPLKPFYQADGRTFHTGRTVATTEAFGYTYPDIPGEGQGRKGVIVQINRLYGDLSLLENRAAASTSRREWVVEIQVDRADLPLPCNIDVYLGDRLAGRTSLLSMPKTGIAHDELPLSRAAKSLDVDDNEAGGIEKRLMNGLRVEVTKVCSGELNVISQSSNRAGCYIAFTCKCAYRDPSHALEISSCFPTLTRPSLANRVAPRLILEAYQASTLTWSVKMSLRQAASLSSLHTATEPRRRLSFPLYTYCRQISASMLSRMQEWVVGELERRIHSISHRVADRLYVYLGRTLMLGVNIILAFLGVWELVVPSLAVTTPGGV
ncbi:hypothetical protein F5B21DRAFT_489533 [Xylaria acuta]|nr:hypothetical protein F5B21DRAFT_489533 [Xylaria acuta]